MGVVLSFVTSLYCRIIAVLKDPEAVLDPLNQATEDLQTLEVS
jgi:hypothetical protein